MDKILKFETLSEFENYDKDMDVNTLYLIKETNGVSIKERGPIYFYVGNEKVYIPYDMTWNDFINRGYYEYDFDNGESNRLCYSWQIDVIDNIVYEHWCHGWHIDGCPEDYYKICLDNDENQYVKGTDLIVENGNYTLILSHTTDGSWGGGE